jgi:hypothetical protein
MIYRDTGPGMSLACGHKSDGIIRGSACYPRYHCPVCRTAERSIYDVQAERRHRKSGWGGVFRKLRARAKASPDPDLGLFVAHELVPLVEDLESGGWSHGHRDGNGWCHCSGEDCSDCDRLERIREWVLAHAV